MCKIPNISLCVCYILYVSYPFPSSLSSSLPFSFILLSPPVFLFSLPISAVYLPHLKSTSQDILRSFPFKIHPQWDLSSSLVSIGIPREQPFCIV